MRKYRTKPNKFWLTVLILVLLIVSASVIFNIILSSSKNKLILSLEEYFDHKISIGRIIYLPPNLVLLKNVSFKEIALSKQNPSLFIPTICMKLSLLEAVTKRHLSVSDIYIYEPNADYYGFKNFIKDNFAQIMAFIRSLPKQDIKFFIKKMKLDFTKEDRGYKYITADFALIIKGSSVSGFGSINKNISGNTTTKFPLRYSFRASLGKNSFFVEKLELKRENFCSELMGSYNGGAFRFSGFAFMNTLFKESERREPVLDMIKNFIFPARGQEAFSVTRVPQANLFILDVNCQGKLEFPKLRIEHLKFSLNNSPVSLKGSLFLSNPISLDLVISSEPKYLKYQYVNDIKRIGLIIKGTLNESIFNSDGILNLDFIEQKKGGSPLERFEFGFNGLTWYFAQYPKLKMQLKDSNVFCKTSENEYKISLKNLNAIYYLQNKRFKYVEFSSLFYDGFLQGRGNIDMAKLPPKVTSIVKVRNVSANNLEGLLIHFSKFHGKLASQMYFTNFPRLFLKGGMVIQEGYSYNLEFFKWLADFFDLPALKKIYFERAASDFLIDDKGASLQRMHLESKDVNLGGFFHLGYNDLVSSKISLAFTRKLLQDSLKFRPLLNLLGKDFKNLIFDFQLSGNLHKMNFQWLQSDFKRKIQASIPHFIERRIDRDIEKIVQTLSSKQQE